MEVERRFSVATDKSIEHFQDALDGWDGMGQSFLIRAFSS